MLSASAVGRVTPAFEVIKACLGCNWCCCLLKTHEEDGTVQTLGQRNDDAMNPRILLVTLN
jgi:hypothetical protein